MRRREFLAAAVPLAGCSGPFVPVDSVPPAPAFLGERQKLYGTDPAAAFQAWFREAGCGLLFEYGVYSQLGRGPQVQFDEQIPLDRYGLLGDTFDPAGFDADGLTSLAVDSGSRYVGLVARHADGFCLFRTIQSDFNSLECSGRDLVGELAEACERKRLGLILSYSYAADWRHPYFYPPETSRTAWRGARPAYGSPPGDYAFRNDEDFLLYVRYAHRQLEEIVFRYDSIAGLRLEPVAGYHARPDLIPVSQAYSILREARPGILLAFGTGANGTEDFASIGGEIPTSFTEPLAASAWGQNRGKPLEICRPLTDRRAGTERASASELADLSRDASAAGANFLVRVELDPDGAVDDEDERTLLEFGRRRGAGARRAASL